MTEAELQLKVTAWARSPVGVKTLRLWQGEQKTRQMSGIALELKMSGNGKTIPFSEIKDHQLISLWEAENDVLTHKIADDAMGFKPCDMVVILGGVGLLVCGFLIGKEKGLRDLGGLGGLEVYAIPVRDVWEVVFIGDYAQGANGINGKRQGSLSLDWCREKGKRII